MSVACVRERGDRSRTSSANENRDAMSLCAPGDNSTGVTTLPIDKDDDDAIRTTLSPDSNQKSEQFKRILQHSRTALSNLVSEITFLFDKRSQIFLRSVDACRRKITESMHNTR